jgi:hypothetical protein
MRACHALLISICMAASAAAATNAELDATAPLNFETYFGINGVGYFHRPDEAEELQKRWELMKELGVRWDRSDFWWSDIEKKPGEWNYAKADAAMRMYREHGVQMLPILDYGAAWRRTEAPANEEQREEWARYVRNVVSRYRNYANYWEVWNEPNIIPFWRPQPRVEDYAALLEVTASAARAANPDARLVAFALADMHEDYLERTLELAPSRPFAAASYHFYRIDAPEKRLPDEIQEMRLILKRFGKDVPVWVTEMGVTSHPTEGVSEELQAIHLMRHILLLIAGGAERVFPFTLVDPTADPGGEWGNKLGMVDLNWRKKPVFDAYMTMIAELDAYEYMGGVHFGDDVKALAFRGRYGTPEADKWKLAAYSTAGPRDIRIQYDDDFDTAAAALEYVEMSGTRRPLQFHERTARLMLTGSPVYVPVVSRLIEHLAWGTRFSTLENVAVPMRHPAAIMASPGEEVRLGLMSTGKPTGTPGIRLQLPLGWQRTTTDAVCFLVPPNARPGWYTVRTQQEQSSATIVRDLRVWVREAARVDFRPYYTTATNEIRTELLIHDVNLREPREWWVKATPEIPEAALPAGVVGSAEMSGPKFIEERFSISRRSLASIASTTLFQVIIAPGRRDPLLPPVVADAFKVAVTPLVEQSPVVDGSLDEYLNAPRLSVGYPGQQILGEYTSAGDAFCTAAAVWTREGIYVAASIDDDHPMMNDFGAGGDVYKGDAVEVYIGPAGHPGGYYARKEDGYYHFALSPGKGGEGAVVSDFAQEVPGAKIAVATRPGGYVMEAFIPVDALGGYVPARGDLIAWDLQLNDRDDYSRSAPTRAFMWNGDRMNWLRSARWGMAVVK